jgi:hypothetical protein
VFIVYVGYRENSFSRSWNSRPIFIDGHHDGAKFLDQIEDFFVILDIVFLIGAISYAIKISKEKSFEMEVRAKFEVEKEWLWLRLKLFFFTSITTFIELVSWRADNEYEIYLIADSIKLLCSVAIFTIIATKENIQALLLKKFGAITNKSERLEFVNNSV